MSVESEVFIFQKQFLKKTRELKYNHQIRNHFEILTIGWEIELKINYVKMDSRTKAP